MSIFVRPLFFSTTGQCVCMIVYCLLGIKSSLKFNRDDRVFMGTEKVEKKWIVNYKEIHDELTKNGVKRRYYFKLPEDHFSINYKVDEGKLKILSMTLYQDMDEHDKTMINILHEKYTKGQGDHSEAIRSCCSINR